MGQPKDIQMTYDEISLKDLIIIFQSWFSLFWQNILLIVSIGVLGASVGLYFAYSHKPVFKAESRFIVKEGGPSGLASSLGSLGSLLGGSGGSSLDKTVAVIGSEKVIGKVLLTSATIGDTKDLVINHFIRLGKLNEKWNTDTVLVRAKFVVADTIPDVFTFPQRKAFKAVLASFIGEKGIIGKSFDKKSGIVSSM